LIETDPINPTIEEEQRRTSDREERCDQGRVRRGGRVFLSPPQTHCPMLLFLAFHCRLHHHPHLHLHHLRNEGIGRKSRSK
ncbi:unnamed protein product, partial [Musa hybrid cultivar]